jgi:hypothetical protein
LGARLNNVGIAFPPLKTKYHHIFMAILTPHYIL